MYTIWSMRMKRKESSEYCGTSSTKLYISSEKEKESIGNIPVAITGWSFAEVWIFSEPWEVSFFSGGSAMTFASDGTRLARSGGWSFPTVGLACDNNTQSSNLTIILRKRANYELTKYYLQINIGRGFSNWIQKLVKIMSIKSCWANKLC